MFVAQPFFLLFFKVELSEKRVVSTSPLTDFRYISRAPTTTLLLLWTADATAMGVGEVALVHKWRILFVNRQKGWTAHRLPAVLILVCEVLTFT